MARIVAISTVFTLTPHHRRVLTLAALAFAAMC